MKNPNTFLTEDETEQESDIHPHQRCMCPRNVSITEPKNIRDHGLQFLPAHAPRGKTRPRRFRIWTSMATSSFRSLLQRNDLDIDRWSAGCIIFERVYNNPITRLQLAESFATLPACVIAFALVPKMATMCTAANLSSYS